MVSAILYNKNRPGTSLPFLSCISRGSSRGCRGIFVGGEAGLKAVASSQQTLTTTAFKEVAMATRTIPKSSDRNDFRSVLTRPSVPILAFSEGRVE